MDIQVTANIGEMVRRWYVTVDGEGDRPWHGYTPDHLGTLRTESLERMMILIAEDLERTDA
jgi:hypothetical protein